MDNYKKCHEYISSRTPRTIRRDIEVYDYDDSSDLVYSLLDDDFSFIGKMSSSNIHPYVRALHRIDGPAQIWQSISKEDVYLRWMLNDIEYTFDEWLELTPLPEKEKVKLRLQNAK